MSVFQGCVLLWLQVNTQCHENMLLWVAWKEVAGGYSGARKN